MAEMEATREEAAHMRIPRSLLGVTLRVGIRNGK
jgi:hypothetical protein